MSLIEKISSNENIYLAIETIKSNPGSKTPGIDGKTIENIITNINKVVLKIKKELSDGKYYTQTHLDLDLDVVQNMQLHKIII